MRTIVQSIRYITILSVCFCSFSLQSDSLYAQVKKTGNQYLECILGKRKCTPQEKSNLKKVGSIGFFILAGSAGVGYLGYSYLRYDPSSFFDKDFFNKFNLSIDTIYETLGVSEESSINEINDAINSYINYKPPTMDYDQEDLNRLKEQLRNLFGLNKIGKVADPKAKLRYDAYLKKHPSVTNLIG